MKAGTMENWSKPKTIAVISALGLAVAGIIAVLEYVNSRTHKKLLAKNAELENQIKQLQLAKLSSELNSPI